MVPDVPVCARDREEKSVYRGDACGAGRRAAGVARRCAAFDPEREFLFHFYSW